ncbi:MULTISPECIES: hypothetical protein [unclassified Duganella]|uniref:hypothetical protein n=1 Tax=unclassified Duganella TaxID=2636909 RepID=UPI0011C12DD9|nr:MULTISPECIES: hypothetical protein [unclassified Duganella]
MNDIKQAFGEGLREGWTLFWSPFVGVYKTAKKIISFGSAKADNGSPFNNGLRDGWIMFWSIFTAFYRAAKAILTSR